jgi:glucose-1-phosphate thymidylyltransferase
MEEMKPTLFSAYILAAGKGTRLYPFSQSVVKPLLPITNKPLILHGVKSLDDAGITQIGVIIRKEEKNIPKIIRKAYPNKEIDFIIQEPPLGTGDAVLQIEPFLKTENIVILAGDSLFPANFIQSLCKKHMKEKNAATLSLEKMEFEQMRYSSTVDYRNGRVWEIREKPKTKNEILSNLNSAALYVFSPTIFNALKQITQSKRKEYELASAITHLIQQNRRVGGSLVSQVFHVSNAFDLWHINLEFLKNDQNKDSQGNLIGKNVILEVPHDITNSIIGNHSIVKKGVKLRNTVILSNSVVNQSYKNSLVSSQHYETFKTV